MEQETLDLELFHKYSKNENDFYETETNPMSPNLFYQLSMIIGFNKINGSTYKNYIDIWTKKYEKKLIN
jgi:hypothetical protein